VDQHATKPSGDRLQRARRAASSTSAGGALGEVIFADGLRGEGRLGKKPLPLRERRWPGVAPQIVFWGAPRLRVGRSRRTGLPGPGMEEGQGFAEQRRGSRWSLEEKDGVALSDLSIRP